jgi:hypothetical protein
MIVGHNFDNISGFKKSLSMGTEPITCPTWRNIRKLLLDSEINIEDCFFTNVYVGLMDSESNVGVFLALNLKPLNSNVLNYLNIKFQNSVQILF